MKFQWLQPNTEEWKKAIPLISQVSWKAGSHLAKQMENNELTGWECVLVCWDQDKLVGFCGLLQTDILKETDLTPFIGVVFVDEAYRGRHISQQLVTEAEQKARSLGFTSTYIATQHSGLYEKFGYEKIGQQTDIFDRYLNVYQKKLAV